MAVKRKPKPLFFILVLFIILLLLIGGIIGTWFYMVSPVDKNNSDKIEIEITSGVTSSQIGHLLQEKGLIRNELLFKIYLKMNHVGNLKASKYTLHKGMSLEEIVKTLEDGNSYNPDEIKITFKEGIRITDYAEEIAKNTNHSAEEFLKLMKDREFVKTFIPNYWFLTDEILNSNIYYPLEGYLAPDTYHFKNKDVEISDIITTMLKQTEKNLETYKNRFEKKPHYYVTMASIIELEGTNTENKELIAGVFENRLAISMNLGSDVTTYYALQLPMTSDLTAEQFNTVNPYNTRSATMAGKMPVGPICNPGKGSLAASVNPTKSDYYYFVADKNKKIYFTKTATEHSQKVAEIKANGDWIW